MKRFTRTNVLLLLAVIALVVAPLVFNLGAGSDEPFAGADGLAEEHIVTTHPDYKPWFHSLYEPPSGEIESGLFALQAALGAGFLGYYFGAARTRRRLTAPTAPAAAREGTAGEAG
jgi:cobalt/nickel transport protein